MRVTCTDAAILIYQHAQAQDRTEMVLGAAGICCASTNTGGRQSFQTVQDDQRSWWVASQAAFPKSTCHAEISTQPQ